MNINTPITVLSLFDGMSCGQIALRELGVSIARYYASEIDKYAIAQTQLNFPNTIQLGSVTDVHAKDLPKIDLFIGGSPCQGFSFAGKQLNFEDPRSKLFFEYVRVLKECREINPDVKFLLENVRMKREYMDVISDMLGVEPVMINSALVSAQNRVRLYWSNIRTAKSGLFGLKTNIPQPKDRNLCIKDILDDDAPENLILSDEVVQNMFAHAARQKAKGNGFGMRPKSLSDKGNALCVGGGGIQDVITLPRPMKRVIQLNNQGGKSPWLPYRIYDAEGILPTLCSAHAGNDPIIRTKMREVIQVNPSCESSGKQPYQQNRVYDANGVLPALCCNQAGNAPIRQDSTIYRRLSIKERSRMQTIPDWYKWECSNTQAAKMLGNGWTIEVIKHIFSFMFEDNQPENTATPTQKTLFD